jgi:hypothetical protein
MKVFISHAEKDRELAYRLAQKLAEAGWKVWAPGDEIFPGDNWALKRGQALERAEMMIVLVTPTGPSSDPSVRGDVQYALTGDRFAGRFLTVYVGRGGKTAGEAPWILSQLPHVQVPRNSGFDEVVEEIEHMLALAR